MSESNKFTPGPWVVSKDDSEIEKFVVAARGTVCEVFESFTADSVWGNAFLISAAPDLLEALERMIDEYGTAGDGWPRNNKVIRDARAAILKARGRQ